MSTPKKKTPRKQYDILRGMEIAENEPVEQLKVDPAVAGEDRSATTWAKLGAQEEPVPPVETPADPWDEYRTLEASRNQSDILLAILHELVRLRSAR